MNKNEYDEIITILNKYSDNRELPLNKVIDIIKQITEKYDLIFNIRGPIEYYKEIQIKEIQIVDKSLNNIVQVGFTNLSDRWLGGFIDNYFDELHIVLMSIYNYLLDPEKYFK